MYFELGEFINYWFNLNFRLMLIEYAVADTQAETHSLTDIIFGEKGLEHTVNILWRDTTAIVS